MSAVGKKSVIKGYKGYETKQGLEMRWVVTL
jgi:hypothetical protein